MGFIWLDWEEDGNKDPWEEKWGTFMLFSPFFKVSLLWSVWEFQVWVEWTLFLVLEEKGSVDDDVDDEGLSLEVEVEVGAGLNICLRDNRCWKEKISHLCFFEGQEEGGKRLP